MVGHIVFRKSYSSFSRFLRYEHEGAYLLAKGNVTPPAKPIPDVLDMPFSGNKLHPTQKTVAALLPLVAAQHLERDWVGMELDPEHVATAIHPLVLHPYRSTGKSRRSFGTGGGPARAVFADKSARKFQ